MINNLFANLQSSMANRHVSVPVALMIGCKIGALWLPDHASQFQTTGEVLMGYAAISAGNSGPVQTTPPAIAPAQPEKTP